jgi:hypothetical protein
MIDCPQLGTTVLESVSVPIAAFGFRVVTPVLGEGPEPVVFAGHAELVAELHAVLLPWASSVAVHRAGLDRRGDQAGGEARAFGRRAASGVLSRSFDC